MTDQITRTVEATDTILNLMDVNSLGEIIPFGGVSMTSYADSTARAVRVTDGQDKRLSSRAVTSRATGKEYQVIDFASALKPVFEVLGVYSPRRSYSASNTATSAEFAFPDGFALDNYAPWDGQFWAQKAVNEVWRPDYAKDRNLPLLRPFFRVTTSLNYGEAMLWELGFERLKCTNGLYTEGALLASMKMSHNNFKPENLVKFLEDINLARSGDVIEHSRIASLFRGTVAAPAEIDMTGNKLCKFAPEGTPNALNRFIKDMQQVLQLRQDSEYRKAFAEQLSRNGGAAADGFDWKDVSAYMHPTSAQLMTPYTRQPIAMQEALVSQFTLLRDAGSAYSSHVTSSDILTAYTNAESVVRADNDDYALDLVKITRDVRGAVNNAVTIFSAMSWLDN